MLKIAIFLGVFARAGLGFGCDLFQAANSEEVEAFKKTFPFLNLFDPGRVYKIETEDGIYVGQLNCETGFREGWGEMSFNNGTLYGPGNIFYYSQGDKYFGQWLKNKQDGMKSKTNIKLDLV